MAIVNPDEQNRRNMMLQQMGQQKANEIGVKMNYNGRTGTKKQLISTVVGIVAAVVILFLLAWFKVI